MLSLQTQPLVHASAKLGSKTHQKGFAVHAHRDTINCIVVISAVRRVQLMRCHRTQRQVTAAAKKGFGARCPRRATCNVKHAVWERTRVPSTTALLAQIVLQIPRQLIQAAPASRTANVTKATLVIPFQVVACSVSGIGGLEIGATAAATAAAGAAAARMWAWAQWRG